MQTGSGALVTAQTSKEQFPECSVLADWRRDGTTFFDPGVFRDTWSDTWEGVGDIGDLTRFVKSIRVARSLSTDLPEGIRQATGLAAADATLVLGGDVGELSLTKVFAPYDNALNTLAPRLKAPISIGLGYRGTEQLPQITGQVRGCLVDADAATVTLSVVDDRLRFSTPVILPVIVADDHGVTVATSDRPGDNAQFLIDWIARQQGYYASPPIRSSCILSATLHGSAWPELGTLTSAAQSDATKSYGQVRYATGRHGLALTANVTDTSATIAAAKWALAGPVDTNQTSNLFVEFDSAMCPGGDTGTLLFVRNAAFTYWIGIGTTPTFGITVGRNGASATWNPTFAYDTDAYLGIHFAFTSAGATVNFRQGSGATQTTNLVVGTPTGGPLLTEALFSSSAKALTSGSGLQIEGLQITTEPFSAGMFNDAFVPTAVLEPSLNELTSTPTVDTSDPWLLVQQIADAEQGIVTFVDDVLHFYNRDHLSGGAAVATITTDPSVSFANLKQSASSDEAVDTVINYVTVPATPYLLDPVSTVIWSLSEVMSVPAGGSLDIPSEFPGPVYQLASRTHRASQTADGTGGDITNLTLTTTIVTASSWITTVTNPNAFPAYLVGNLSGGTPGEPNLNIVGRCVRPSEFPYTSIRTDAASVAAYGTQPLDVADNPFRQSKAAADTLCVALLANLADPHPEIGDLEIVGDPRTQLTDRTRVADPDGLVLDDDFWLTARKTRYSASDGLAQAVSLRQA